MYLFCTHGPKEEQRCVEVGPPWLNKVESESKSQQIQADANDRSKHNIKTRK